MPCEPMTPFEAAVAVQALIRAGYLRGDEHGGA